MTNQLNLTPMKPVATKLAINSCMKHTGMKLNNTFSITNQYTKTGISRFTVINNLSKVKTDFKKPLYQRIWTITQLNKILLGWYEMDINVNDLLPDDLRLLQAFYQSFSKLSDNEQEQLIEAYHPYTKRISSKKLIAIKHKILKYHAELITNNG